MQVPVMRHLWTISLIGALLILLFGMSFWIPDHDAPAPAGNRTEPDASTDLVTAQGTAPKSHAGPPSDRTVVTNSSQVVGRVVLYDGTGCANARVAWEVVAGSDQAQGPWRGIVTSNADGAFRIPCAPTTRLHLSASAPARDLMSTRVVTIRPGRKATIELALVRAIGVQLVDGSTGASITYPTQRFPAIEIQGIPAARWSRLSNPVLASDLISGETPIEAVVESAAQGSLAICCFKAGPPNGGQPFLADLSVNLEGYRPYKARGLRLTNLESALHNPYIIALERDSGSWTWVDITFRGSNGHLPMEPHFLAIRSEQHGEWLFPARDLTQPISMRVHPGEYLAGCSASGFSPMTLSRFAAAPLGEDAHRNQWTLDVQARGTLLVEAVDEAGRSVPPLVNEICGVDESNSQIKLRGVWPTINPNRVRIQGLPAGRYELTVVAGSSTMKQLVSIHSGGVSHVVQSVSATGEK